MLVTEGHLMQLWFEVEQVRNEEKREAFRLSFKQLLNEAQLVAIVPQRKLKPDHEK